MVRLFRGALSACFVALLLAACSREPGERSPAQQKAATSPDVVYAGYRFGGPGIVDLGVQPLSLPEASVSELLARDGTLAEALAREQLTLTPLPFFKGKDIGHFMAKGLLEGGVLGDMPSIVAAASGEVVIVALTKQGFSSIVARDPILVRDLKGKRVATAPGSTAHFTLLNALNNEGLTEGDIELVGMEVARMPQALNEGIIEAFCAWEPTPTVALSSNPRFRVIHRGLNFAFLCFRRDFALSHPAAVQEVAAAVARSCLWMRRPGTLKVAAGWTLAAADQFLGTSFPLTEAQLISITRADLLNVPGAPRIPQWLLQDDGLLRKEFEFLKRAGKIPSGVPWARVRDAFDTQLMEDLRSAGGRYPLERFHYHAKKGKTAP